MKVEIAIIISIGRWQIANPSGYLPHRRATQLVVDGIATIRHAALPS
jgi:hypothetical protein